MSDITIARLQTLIQQDVYALLDAEFNTASRTQFDDAMQRNEEYAFMVIDSWANSPDRIKGGADVWRFTLTLRAFSGGPEQGHEFVYDLVWRGAHLIDNNALDFDLKDDGESAPAKYRVSSVSVREGTSDRMAPGGMDNPPIWTATQTIHFEISSR